MGDKMFISSERKTYIWVKIIRAMEFEDFLEFDSPLMQLDTHKDQPDTDMKPTMKSLSEMEESKRFTAPEIASTSAKHGIATDKYIDGWLGHRSVMFEAFNSNSKCNDRCEMDYEKYTKSYELAWINGYDTSDLISKQKETFSIIIEKLEAQRSAASYGYIQPLSLEITPEVSDNVKANFPFILHISQLSARRNLEAQQFGIVQVDARLQWSSLINTFMQGHNVSLKLNQTMKLCRNTDRDASEDDRDSAWNAFSDWNLALYAHICSMTAPIMAEDAPAVVQEAIIDEWRSRCTDAQAALHSAQSYSRHVREFREENLADKEPMVGHCDLLSILQIPAFFPSAVHKFDRKKFSIIVHQEPLSSHLPLEPSFMNDASTALQIMILGVKNGSANEARMCGVSAVAHLRAIGITDFPVFTLVTNGVIGVVNCFYATEKPLSPPYKSSVKLIKAIEVHAQTFDISNPLEALNFAVFLCWLSSTHTRELQRRLDEVKTVFLEKCVANDQSLEWCMEHQFPEP